MSVSLGEPRLLTGDPAVGLPTLAAYEAAGGYAALRHALAQLAPAEVVRQVRDAGLRGRGGAGFPTGDKLALARMGEPGPRYVVCNAGEDEPGSIKDRLLQERYPHRVLEGVILAAYAIGAQDAFLYINSEQPVARAAMERAAGEARAAGYLGRHVGSSNFSLEVIVVSAPPSYVAGEDTAALEVIEGRAPLPRDRPPYPTAHGLFGRPTLVNNVETLANLPAIVEHGAEWFRRQGTVDAPGTMIFALGPEMARPGAYELPLGTPLRVLLEDIGGGLADGRPLRAVLPGGPSSAFLTPDQLDLPLTYRHLRAAGSSLGCGVVRAFGEGTCLVEVAVELAAFFAAETCGQCPACRMETGVFQTVLRQIQAGKGTPALFDQIGAVAGYAADKGKCGFISMPVPPLASALRLFRGDFAHHLAHGACPS